MKITTLVIPALASLFWPCPRGGGQEQEEAVRERHVGEHGSHTVRREATWFNRLGSVFGSVGVEHVNSDEKTMSAVSASNG